MIFLQNPELEGIVTDNPLVAVEHSYLLDGIGADSPTPEPSGRAEPSEDRRSIEVIRAVHIGSRYFRHAETGKLIRTRYPYE